MQEINITDHLIHITKNNIGRIKPLTPEQAKNSIIERQKAIDRIQQYSGVNILKNICAEVGVEYAG